MVALGRVNSRMKDFYDIWVIARTFPFADDRLPRAIAATFARCRRRNRSVGRGRWRECSRWRCR